MSRNNLQGQLDWCTKAMFALATAGLCFSVVMSISLHEMVVSGMNSEPKTTLHATAVSATSIPLSAEQISEITGQTDVLNKILMNGLMVSSPKSNRNGIGYFQQPGGAL